MPVTAAPETRRDRERVVHRVRRKLMLQGIVANFVAVAMIATVTAVTARAYFGEGIYRRVTEVNLMLLVPQSVIAVVGAWLFARWLLARRMAWFIEGRPATEEEQRKFVSLPLFLATTVNLVAWTAFETTYLLYLIHVEHIGWPASPLAKEIAANAMGLVMGSTLVYLIAEHAIRPFTSLALGTDFDRWPRSPGLGPRLVTLWFAVAGAPLLLVAFTSLGLSPDRRGLVVPGLRVLAILAAILGLVTFVVAGRTITGPLRQLQSALRHVSKGDLAVRVPIEKTDEIGHLEAGFNEMVEQLRDQVAAIRASRARIVEAADTERARIERNLHDGAQQRLLALSFALRSAQGRLQDPGLDEALHELDAAMAELRELARGIHPAILDEEGLGPALSSLAERAPVPTEVRSVLNGRLPSPVEVTAYFVVAESLANVARYADASTVKVEAVVSGDALRVEVADDGKGGADPHRGSGLRGLADRVAALGGELMIESPRGAGTKVHASIPIGDT